MNNSDKLQLLHNRLLDAQAEGKFQGVVEDYGVFKDAMGDPNKRKAVHTLLLEAQKDGKITNVPEDFDIFSSIVPTEPDVIPLTTDVSTPANEQLVNYEGLTGTQPPSEVSDDGIKAIPNEPKTTPKLHNESLQRLESVEALKIDIPDAQRFTLDIQEYDQKLVEKAAKVFGDSDKGALGMFLNVAVDPYRPGVSLQNREALLATLSTLDNMVKFEEKIAPNIEGLSDEDKAVLFRFYGVDEERGLGMIKSGDILLGNVPDDVLEAYKFVNDNRGKLAALREADRSERKRQAGSPIQSPMSRMGPTATPEEMVELARRREWTPLLDQYHESVRKIKNFSESVLYQKNKGELAKQRQEFLAKEGATIFEVFGNDPELVPDVVGEEAARGANIVVGDRTEGNADTWNMVAQYLAANPQNVDRFTQEEVASPFPHAMGKDRIIRTAASWLQDQLELTAEIYSARAAAHQEDLKEMDSESDKLAAKAKELEEKVSKFDASAYDKQLTEVTAAVTSLNNHTAKATAKLAKVQGLEAGMAEKLSNLEADFKLLATESTILQEIQERVANGTFDEAEYMERLAAFNSKQADLNTKRDSILAEQEEIGALIERYNGIVGENQAKYAEYVKILSEFESNKENLKIVAGAKELQELLDSYNEEADAFRDKWGDLVAHLGVPNKEEIERLAGVVGNTFGNPSGVVEYLQAWGKRFAGSSVNMVATVQGAAAQRYNINSPSYARAIDQAVELSKIGQDISASARLKDSGFDWVFGLSADMVPSVATFIGAGYIGAKTGGAIFTNPAFAHTFSMLFSGAVATATYGGEYPIQAEKAGLSPHEARDVMWTHGLVSGGASIIVPSYMGSAMAKVFGRSWSKNEILKRLATAGITAPAESIGETIAQISTIMGLEAMGIELSDEDKNNMLLSGAVGGFMMGGAMPLILGGSYQGSLEVMVESYLDAVDAIDVGRDVKTLAMGTQLMSILRSMETRTPEAQAVLDYLEQSLVDSDVKIKSSDVNKGYELMAAKAGEVYSRDAETNGKRYVELSEKAAEGILTYSESLELMAIWANDVTKVNEAYLNTNIQTIYRGMSAAGYKVGDIIGDRSSGNTQGQRFEVKEIDRKTGKMRISNFDGEIDMGWWAPKDLKQTYLIDRDLQANLRRIRDEGDVEWRDDITEVVEQINTKYDAESAALEQDTSIEAKKADIEKRRQEEKKQKGLSTLIGETVDNVINKFISVKNALTDTVKTGEILKKYLPQRVGNYVISSNGTFPVGGNWRIAYEQESAERTNINTGEKFTSINSQYVVLDSEILLSGDAEAIKNHIEKNIEIAGLNNSKKELADKINAKYDAELKALEAPVTSTTQERADKAPKADPSSVTAGTTEDVVFTKEGERQRVIRNEAGELIAEHKSGKSEWTPYKNQEGKVATQLKGEAQEVAVSVETAVSEKSAEPTQELPTATREVSGKEVVYEKRGDGIWVNKATQREVKSEGIIAALEQQLTTEATISPASRQLGEGTPHPEQIADAIRERFESKPEKDIFAYGIRDGSTFIGFESPESPRNIKAHPNLFSHRDGLGYGVSDKKTGIILATASTLKGAIDKAVSRLDKATNKGETQRETLDRLTTDFIDSMVSNYLAGDNVGGVEAIDAFLGRATTREGTPQPEQTADATITETATERRVKSATVTSLIEEAVKLIKTAQIAIVSTTSNIPGIHLFKGSDFQAKDRLRHAILSVKPGDSRVFVPDSALGADSGKIIRKSAGVLSVDNGFVYAFRSDVDSRGTPFAVHVKLDKGSEVLSNPALLEVFRQRMDDYVKGLFEGDSYFEKYTKETLAKIRSGDLVSEAKSKAGDILTELLNKEKVEQTADATITETATEETVTPEVATKEQAETIQVPPAEKGEVVDKKKPAIARKSEPKEVRTNKRKEAGLPTKPKSTTKSFEKGDFVKLGGSEGIWKVEGVTDDGYRIIRQDSTGHLGGVDASELTKTSPPPKRGLEGRAKNALDKWGTLDGQTQRMGVPTSMAELKKIANRLPKVYKVLIKALGKIAPDIQFVTHGDSDSYLAALPKDNRTAAQGTNAYYHNNVVHLLLNNKLRMNTPYHEALHPVLNAIKDHNPQLYTEIIEGVYAMLQDGGNEAYIRFGESYVEYDALGQQEEAVIEYLADVATNRLDFNVNKNILQKIIDFIRRKLFPRDSQFRVDLDSDIVAIAHNLANALADGKVIVLGETGKATVVEAEAVDVKAREPQFQKQGAIEATLKDVESTAKALEGVDDKTLESITPFKEERVSHQMAFDEETTTTLDDMTKGGDLIPSDFYKMPHYYANIKDKATKESLAVIMKSKDNPNAKVTIYRGLPKGGVKAIKNGDWVSLSKEYAKGEGETIVSMEVLASDLRWDGNDVNEFAYFPKEPKIANSKFISEAYHKAKADGSNPELISGVEALVAQAITEDVGEPQFQKQGFPTPLTFKSTAKEGLGKIRQSAATPEQWVKQIAEKGGKGTSQELEWIGLRDYLNTWRRENKAKSVPKEVVEQYINDNQIEIVEVNKLDKPLSPDNFDIDFRNGEFVVTRNGVDEKTFKSDARANDYIAQQEISDGSGITKYSQYQLEGGENYREVLFILPTKRQKATVVEVDGKWRIRHIDGSLSPAKYISKGFAEKGLDEYIKTEKDGFRTDKETFRSPHWDESNPLAHLRLNERTLPNGERVLFIEEVQSDWAQEGKKKGFRGEFKVKAEDGVFNIYSPVNNYESPAFSFDTKAEADKMLETLGSANESKLPDMPYKKTDQWVGMVMRRVLQMAAQEGYDRVSWVTGEQSADRYSLKGKVNSISVAPKESGRFVFIDMKGNYDVTLNVDDSGKIIEDKNNLNGAQSFKGKQLEDVVGKDMADKILSQKEENKFEGKGLEVGGEGMKTFYNSILPKVVAKEAKRVDKKAKVEVVDFKGSKKGASKQLSIPITPEMRGNLTSAIPQFQKQGEGTEIEAALDAIRSLENEDISGYAIKGASPHRVAFGLTAIDRAIFNFEEAKAVDTYLEAYDRLNPTEIDKGIDLVYWSIAMGLEWKDINPYISSTPITLQKVGKQLMLNEDIFTTHKRMWERREMKGAKFARALNRIASAQIEVGKQEGAGLYADFQAGISSLDAAKRASRVILDDVRQEFRGDPISYLAEGLEMAAIAWQDAVDPSAMISGTVTHFMFEELIWDAEVLQTQHPDLSQQIAAIKSEIFATMSRLEVFGGRFNAAVTGGAMTLGGMSMSAVMEMVKARQEGLNSIVTIGGRTLNVETFMKEDIAALRKTMKESGYLETAIDAVITEVSKTTPRKAPPVGKVGTTKIKAGKAKMAAGMKKLSAAIGKQAGFGMPITPEVVGAVKDIFIGALEVTQGHLQRAIALTKKTINKDIEIEDSDLSNILAKVGADYKAEIDGVLLSTLADKLKAADLSSSKAVQSVMSSLVASVAKGKTKADRLAALVSNVELLHQVTDQVRVEILMTSDEVMTPAQKAERLQVLDDIVGGKDIVVSKFGDKIMAQAANEALRESGISFQERLREVLRDFYNREERGDALSADLGAVLVKKLDLTVSQARRIAAAMNRHVSLQIAKKQAAWAERILTPREAKDPKKAQGKIERFAELASSGALDNDSLMGLLMDKYDLPILTNQQILDLKRLSYNVYKAAPGIARNAAERALATYLFHTREVPGITRFMSAFRDIYYVNILSGLATTGMRNFMGPLFVAIKDVIIPDLLTNPRGVLNFFRRGIFDKTMRKLTVGAGLAVLPDVMGKGYSDLLYAETPPQDARYIDVVTNNIRKYAAAGVKGDMKSLVKAMGAGYLGIATLAVRMNMVMDNILTPIMVEYEAYMTAYDQAKKGKLVRFGKEFIHDIDTILAINQVSDFETTIDAEIARKQADLAEMREDRGKKSKVGELVEDFNDKAWVLRYKQTRMKELVMQARDENLQLSSERAGRAVTLLNSPNGILPSAMYNWYNKAVSGWVKNNDPGALAIQAITTGLLTLNLPIVRVPLNMAVYMYHWTPLHGIEMAGRWLHGKFSPEHDTYGYIYTDGVKKTGRYKLPPHEMRRRWVKVVVDGILFMALYHLLWDHEEFAVGDKFVTRKVPSEFQRNHLTITGGKYIGNPIDIGGNFRYNAIHLPKLGITMEYLDSPFLMSVLSQFGNEYNDYVNVGRGPTGGPPIIDDDGYRQMVMRYLMTSTNLVTSMPDFTFMQGISNILSPLGAGGGRHGSNILDPEAADTWDKVLAMMLAMGGGASLNDPARLLRTMLIPNAYQQVDNTARMIMGASRDGSDGFVGSMAKDNFLLRWASHFIHVDSKVDIPIPNSKNPYTLNTRYAVDAFGYPVPVIQNTPYPLPIIGTKVMHNGELMDVFEVMRSQSKVHHYMHDPRIGAVLYPRTYMPNRRLGVKGSIDTFDRNVWELTGKSSLSNADRKLINRLYRDQFGKMLNAYFEEMEETTVRGGNNLWESAAREAEKSTQGRQAVVEYLRAEVLKVHDEARLEAQKLFIWHLRAAKEGK